MFHFLILTKEGLEKCRIQSYFNKLNQSETEIEKVGDYSPRCVVMLVFETSIKYDSLRCGEGPVIEAPRECPNREGTRDVRRRDSSATRWCVGTGDAESTDTHVRIRTMIDRFLEEVEGIERGGAEVGTNTGGTDGDGVRTDRRRLRLAVSRPRVNLLHSKCILWVERAENDGRMTTKKWKEEK